MLNMMTELVNKFLTFLMKVLPLSPFADFIATLTELPYLGYINFFVPIGTFLKIGTAWVGAIALFYLYSIIMRWVKMIE